ncbi:MAG: 2-oxoacid:acceptor oxidoreductase family protein [Eubacteriaceae bacterium]|jgi:2-oxoglutarate ferredoxin oxidoreductase subunit gamma|nr:2-oxoacid:acceptor oxidoreductase family protein [Eubacteriaceae bacterium]
MIEKVIMAGFGGQGVMLIGQLLTYAGMYEGKEVSWLPSYGPEMRGGTANCHVTVSEKPIASPIITKATSSIIMNNPSLTKFEGSIVAGGDLYINSTLVDMEPTRTDIHAFRIAASEIAEKAGSPRSANMVMLGAYLGRHPVVLLETVESVLRKTMTGSKEKYVSSNMDAIRAGIEISALLPK